MNILHTDKSKMMRVGDNSALGLGLRLTKPAIYPDFRIGDGIFDPIAWREHSSAAMAIMRPVEHSDALPVAFVFVLEQPMLVITVVGSGMAQFEEAAHILGSKAKAGRAFARAVNRTGDTVRNEAGRKLADQTGLPKTTGKKAYRQGGERATPATLSYVVHGKGGDVGLKYFKPKETDIGVSAAPWGKRQVYVGSFMRAGWWPERVDKPNWNGHVFYRRGDGHSYDGLKSKGGKRVGTKFGKAKSGLIIPTEMVQGIAGEAWRAGARRLAPRIEHEVRRMTKGIVS